ncbi:Hypothetical protein NTJ_04222 [Nesidiocoris tenuis]|uniref:Uncharacterized protein n=1 Tax=Nesidiocoris tenuis TaxID=355587 RepID=A0ABN7AJ73_9HEMI|nr:Hypothetical protein NTJ_04222 [Nesidiocoris tenuis]
MSEEAPAGPARMEIESSGGTEARRKSLGLLKDITQSWSADPDKYTLSEAEDPCPGSLHPIASAAAAAVTADASADLPPPQPQVKMSSMEEESVRDRLRLRLLRQCADILDAEPRHTKETFRRAFLNKVRHRQT